MKERPIIFNTSMVRAILDGRKTQTRRAIKSQPLSFFGQWYPTPWTERSKYYGTEKHFRKGMPIDFCPYGIPGDWLWVREAWASFKGDIYYRAEGSNNARIEETVGWKPSIFMPRWASRIDLEITDIRVERVQDIIFGNICNEGLSYTEDSKGLFNDWIALWNSINAKRGYGWDVNPWVWVISFRRIEEC